MKKLLSYSLFLMLLAGISVKGQEHSLLPPLPDSLFLSIQHPQQDSLLWNFSRIRYGGCTRPDAQAFLNNIQLKVYPSGAFAGVYPLQYGKNILRFTAITSNGDSVSREYLVYRQSPSPPFSPDTLAIDETSLEPSREVWLTTGDILEVQMKATPGLEAYFEIPNVAADLPMEEIVVNNAPSGLYVGRYTVKAGDRGSSQPVIFHLKKSFWSKEKAFSAGRVSFLTEELPRVAELVGKRPFLNIGLGTNRLGGAKLGFLEEGIRTVITGKIGNQYRVQLSNSLIAWLPQEFAKLLPPATPLPKSEVGAITVGGNSVYDLVTVTLSTKLPYTSEQILQPTALVVDIYGAVSNTNWIAHQQTAKEITSVTCTQLEDQRYRITIYLRHAYHWGYDITYEGTTLRIKINRPPRPAGKATPLTGLTIALDAGHGGEENRGAIGATGALEKDITLAIVHELRKELTARGARVFLTRTDTTAPSTADRIEPILRSTPRLLVSIHCNSCGEASDPFVAQGVSVYYKHTGFKPLADTLYAHLLALGLQPYGVIGNFNFLLNALTQMPNILIETAFLSHPEDEMLLLDPAFRQQLARQIAKGLEAYVKSASE